MRIGIDANPIMRHRGGIGWHTYHLLRHLIEVKDDDTEYVAYVERGQANAEVMREPWARSSRLRWVESPRWLMPLRGRLDRLDLYHGPNFKLRTQGRCGGVVTIHDLWLDRFPHYSPKLFGQRRSFRKTKRTALRAKKVITVSRYSAQDITDLCGVPPERIAVIYNGVSEEFHPGRRPEIIARLKARTSWPAERFILFAGGADPRKNHRVLIRAYAERAESLRPYLLVMAGSGEHRLGNIRETASAYGVGDRVICTGPLNVEELIALYAQAEVFVFPSLYEGFGMPVVEAMACGAPVITSNTTSLPEVAGDAAMFVDPQDHDGLGRALLEVLTKAEVRDAMRAKGFARAKQFTWHAAAEQTLAVYREVCTMRCSS